MAENTKTTFDRVVKTTAEVATVMFGLGRAVYIGNSRADVTFTASVRQLSSFEELTPGMAYFVDMPSEILHRNAA